MGCCPQQSIKAKVQYIIKDEVVGELILKIEIGQSNVIWHWDQISRWLKSLRRKYEAIPTPPESETSYLTVYVEARYEITKKYPDNEFFFGCSKGINADDLIIFRHEKNNKESGLLFKDKLLSPGSSPPSTWKERNKTFKKSKTVVVDIDKLKLMRVISEEDEDIIRPKKK